jgi:hypothetical protein
MDITKILAETTSKCSDIKSQCAILGVSIPYLYSIIRKYCGEDYISFMEKHAIGNRKLLYSKKKSNNIN